MSERSNDTVIAASLSIRGLVRGKGDVHIEGRLYGHLQIRGDLLIDHTGQVHGNIDANRVDINGIVNGDVMARASVSVGNRGYVRGDIHSPSVSMPSSGNHRGSKLPQD